WIRSSRVLLDQVQEEIRELAWLVGELGSRRSVFSISRLGSQHNDVTGDIVLISPGALARAGAGLEQIEAHGPVSLICIDDAWMVADDRVRAVIDRLLGPQVKVLGLTGAPLDASAPEEGLRQWFSDGQSFQLSFRDLVEAHHSARPVFIRKRLGSTRNLNMSSAGVHWAIRGRKDFPGPMLRAMVQTQGRNREILGHWLDHRSRYGPTLVFAYDEDHAAEMSRWLIDHGVPNDAVFPGLDPGKRKQRLERFRRRQSEVLVIAGLLTQGEHVMEVQTVVLARPTLSPVLYKHMVGHGARKPPVLGKSFFYVVDCIDDLEQFGVSLAGRSAAVELDADFEDTTTMVVPTEVFGIEQRRNKALISTRAWQILRHFADDHYSVWGELVWTLPKGGDKSVIVFHEGVARLRTAVDLVEAALARGDLVPLREMGKELDWLGAMRDVDWQEMLGDCAETGDPPQLHKSEETLIPASVEACARILAQLVEEMLAGRMTIHAAMEACDSLIADSEPLQDQFRSVIELRQELLKLYHDAVSRVEVHTLEGKGDRRAMIDAFVRFTVGVAMADEVLHESESRAIVKAVTRIFDLNGDEQEQWVVDAVERYRGESLDIQETAERLRTQATRAELYHMYDWLFRVAFADGVFVDEERALLHEAAQALGIPSDEVEELEARYTATLPKTSSPPPSGPNGGAGPPSLMPAPRLRYCTQCGYPRQLGAEFCVSCGAELPKSAAAKT
ncbi:MAG: TerB family tellurite resistance protein, partial [Myxococcota bacterium]